MYIDIRSHDKFLLGHIDGAVNIDLFNLLSNPSKYLDKEKIYYIYCDSGNKSKRVVLELNKMGYRCVNIDGGYNKYCLNHKKL